MELRRELAQAFVCLFIVCVIVTVIVIVKHPLASRSFVYCLCYCCCYFIDTVFIGFVIVIVLFFVCLSLLFVAKTSLSELLSSL